MKPSHLEVKKPRERKKEENKRYLHLAYKAILNNSSFRFLWPVPLDNDFIAAVFDVGANATTLVP